MIQPSPAPTRAAVIDIGSATVHLLAASWEPRSKTLTPLLEWSERPMLGAHVERTGSIPLAVIDRVAQQLQMLVHRAQTVVAPLRLLLATQAVRQAQNRSLACQAWEAAAGLNVTTITPAEEAALALLGAQQGAPIGTLLFTDSGGGSTQIVLQHDGNITRIITLPVGASSLTTSTLLHDPPTLEEWAHATAKVREALVSVPPPSLPEPKHALATGGSALTLLLVQAALFQENGMLVLDQLEHILRLLYHTPSSIIAQRFNLTPERARILPAGAIIWRELVHWSHVSYWHISRSGLRDGALYLFFQYESGWRAWLQRYTTEHGSHT